MHVHGRGERANKPVGAKTCFPREETSVRFFTSRRVAHFVPVIPPARLQMQDGMCKLKRQSKRNSSRNLDETLPSYCNPNFTKRRAIHRARSLAFSAAKLQVLGRSLLKIVRTHHTKCSIIDVSPFCFHPRGLMNEKS